jgi:hypothetical protein
MPLGRRRIVSGKARPRLSRHSSTRQAVLCPQTETGAAEPWAQFPDLPDRVKQFDVFNDSTQG